MNYRLLKKISLVFTISCCLCFIGCSSKKTSDRPAVATTSSYLTAAIKDILGNDYNVLTLSGPGNCPGHFDIKPSQIESISTAKVFLRFNFQKHFDSKLSRFAKNGLDIIPIAPAGGMCDPKTYKDLCRQVADALNKVGLITQTQANTRLSEIDQKLLQLSSDIKDSINSQNLAGCKVVAAKHQEAFCKAIGLNVVTPYSGSDIPAELSAVVAKAKGREVKFVIGNAPQGQAVPQRLAKLINCHAVMFDNFPALTAAGFYDLVKGNIDKLCEAKP